MKANIDASGDIDFNPQHSPRCHIDGILITAKIRFSSFWIHSRKKFSWRSLFLNGSAGCWLSTKANFTCAFASQFSSWNVVNASGLIVYMRIRCILCSQTYAHFNMSVRVSLSILCSLCRSPRQTHSTTHSLALNWLKKHFSLSPLAKRKGNTCNVFAAALSRSARRIERVSAVFQRANNRCKILIFASETVNMEKYRIAVKTHCLLRLQVNDVPRKALSSTEQYGFDAHATVIAGGETCWDNAQQIPIKSNMGILL